MKRYHSEFSSPALAPHKNSRDRFFHEVFTNQTVETAWRGNIINLIDQGSGSDERDGVVIRMKELRLSFHAISQHTTESSTVRCVILYDKSPVSGAEAITEDIDDIAAKAFQKVAGANTQHVIDFMNENYAERFDVVFDQNFVVGAKGSDSARQAYGVVIPLNKRAVYVNPIPADSSEMSVGPMWVMWVTDQIGTVVNSKGPLIHSYTRVLYEP